MKRIRIGVFGALRGAGLATNFMMLNCEIVALCDKNPERLAHGAKRLGDDVVLYDDFDKFIEHDMDVVILANFFNEHAPYAIKCFERGLHVYSECISNGTMAEGVELIRAFEKSKSIYFLAENYPQMIFNREAKRVADGGSLGKIVYAEGEYNHPTNPYDKEFKKMHVYYREHWRNYLPASYYITHSLGPVMHVTGATPKRVTAFGCYAPNDADIPFAKQTADIAAEVMTLNDDGSVFRITGCAGFGGQHNAYRFCGTKGQIENVRGLGKVMLRYNDWETPEGMEPTTLYEPQWNDKDEELIKKSGHGGADYITARKFVECIKENKQPEHPFDIYSAINMSSVAILAHRSMLEGGVPYDIPDFHLESEREKYEGDRLTPFVSPDGDEPTLPSCSHPDYKPKESQLKAFDELLRS